MARQWNKVSKEPVRTWKKVDVALRQSNVNRYINEPVATLCKQSKDSKKYQSLTFNLTASAIICKNNMRRVDFYRCGAYFAFSAGDSMNINTYENPKRRDGTFSRTSQLSCVDACDLMYTATRCKTFRVSYDAGMLILSPAYDLDSKKWGNG